MTAIVDLEKCNGAGACIDCCPSEAITKNDDDKAVVDADLCADCGVCEDECPNDAITIE
jgi:NAD-dependent dihydropyrimidine dehydrogenase PreA subunit